MRSRAVVLAVVAILAVPMLAGAAQAGSGHHDDHRGRHSRSVTITGEVGKAPGRHHRHGRHQSQSSDALRYVGDQKGKRRGRHQGRTPPADYLRGDPFIVTMPDRAATTLSGWVWLKRGVPGSVATIGLVDLASLEDGQSGRQEGAFFYVFTRRDGRVRVGLTDGNIGGELVQVSQYFEAGRIPRKIWVEFTVERTDDEDELGACATSDVDEATADGCMTLVINDGDPIVDSFGSIAAADFDDEFADGAVPGWEAYPGGTTGIKYALRVAPAYAR